MTFAKLIAVEGGDGCGKSTQASLLANELNALLTRQPGGTAFGAKLREILLDKSTQGLSSRAEAMLFMADRAEHVDKVIRPALASGKSVVSDRWAYSSLVYQGYGRGLSVDDLVHISDWAMDGLWPDIVVLLDIPLDVAASRQGIRGDELDRFEAEGDALQRDVVRGYRDLAAHDPQRWRVVDGTGSVEAVFARVCEAVGLA